ncbi:MAG: DUF6550 family protein, partial [Hydrogenoanaerobacterium sp.]
QLRPNENPPQNNGGTNGGGTTPNKPNTPDTPTGGETNNKGQVFVPGFGWINDPGNGSGHCEVAENAGTGEVIGY